MKEQALSLIARFEQLEGEVKDLVLSFLRAESPSCWVPLMGALIKVNCDTSVKVSFTPWCVLHGILRGEL